MNTAAHPQPRGRYGRLDREVILDAALRVAARPGAAEVRIRDLGEELGADPTAVYRHFRNKQALIEALIDRIMDDIVRSVPKDVPWRTVLHTIAADLLKLFTRHPAIGLHLADTRPVGGAELALVERVLSALEDAGLRDDALIARYSALSGFTLAYVASTCRELVLAGRATADADDLPWLPDIDIVEELHPTFARYRERLEALDFRSTYDTAITLLIDSIEAG